MKSTSFIEFKKKREVGEILSDSFKFLRKNVKPLFRILIRTAGIPFLLVIIVNTYNAYAINTVNYIDPTDPFGVFKTSTVLIGTLLNYVFMFIYSVLLFLTVHCAIVSYIQNDGVINETETLSEVKKFIGNAFLTGFIKYILLLFGFFLCVIPSIYLSVPMMLFFPILIFERTNVGVAFNKAFSMSNEEWFASFGALALAVIILIAVNSAFSIPAALFGIADEFTNVGYAEDDALSFADIMNILFVSLASACQYLIYIIVPITGALVYHSINEKTTQTGAIERIESLGDNNFNV